MFQNWANHRGTNIIIAKVKILNEKYKKKILMKMQHTFIDLKKS